MWKEIRIKAPTRVDLAGGTLDLWPLHHLIDDAVTVNVAVDLFASCRLRRAEKNFVLESEDRGIKLEKSWDQLQKDSQLPLVSKIIWALSSEKEPLDIATHALSPVGAGLGGSSSLAITIIRGVSEAVGADVCEEKIVANARDIEASLLGQPTGLQDYWAAMRGGVNRITYPPGGCRVETLDGHQMEELGEWLLLCDSQDSRFSGINNWDIFQQAVSGDRRIKEVMQNIADESKKCGEALWQGDLQKALHFSEREWNCRLSLSSQIETTKTKAIHKAAMSEGALFTRVCGAGGGGVMAVFCDPLRRKSVSEACQAAGGNILTGSVTRQGLKVDVDR